MSNVNDAAPAASVNHPCSEAESADSGFSPLTAEQARAWRAAHPPVSPWPAVAAQAAAGAACLGIAWLAGASRVLLLSLLWGVLCAWLPAVLFARVMARSTRGRSAAGGVFAALMVGEAIKVALTIGLLLAAPKVLAYVNWLALLAGFVVTIKAAWVAWWWVSSRRNTVQRRVNR